VSDESERTGRARRAAELALVRVCSHYGERPNFVLLGGLVPAILCSDSGRLHAGTTDVVVQVDLEIADGAEHARRLEIALKNAEFHVDAERIWRWETVQGGGYKAVIKFELLADLDDQQQGASVHFDNTEKLGAVNLRGTAYASRDYTPRTLTAYDQGAKPRSRSGDCCRRRPARRRGVHQRPARGHHRLTSPGTLMCQLMRYRSCRSAYPNDVVCRTSTGPTLSVNVNRGPEMRGRRANTDSSTPPARICPEDVFRVQVGCPGGRDRPAPCNIEDRAHSCGVFRR